MSSSWSRLAALAWLSLALGYLVVSGPAIWGRLGPSHIGISAVPREEGAMLVSRVHPGGAAWDAGVRPGDVVLEVDGVAVDVAGWEKGRDARVTFKVLSTTSKEIIEGSTQETGVFSLPLSVSLLLAGFVFGLTSLFLFSRTSRPPPVMVLSILCMTGAWALTLAPAAGQWLWWAQMLDAISVSWTAALFLMFFYLFPPREPASVSQNKYLLFAILVVPVLVTVLWPVSVSLAPTIFTTVRQSYLGATAGSLVLGALLMVRSYFTAHSSVVREQLRVMAFGTVTPIMPFALLGIAPLASGLQPVVRPEVLVLAVVLFPLSFCYAILRHQLMGIRRLVHRSAAYFLLLSVILGAYVAVLSLVTVVGGQRLGDMMTIQLVLLLVLVVGIPLISGSRKFAYAAVDRLLYREYVDYGHLVRRVSLRAASTTRLDELPNTVLTPITQDLRLSFAAFFEIAYGTATVKAIIGAIPDHVLANLTTEFARDVGLARHVRAVFLPSLNAHVVLAPLQNRAEHPWVACFGPKSAEEPFHREDIEALQVIAGQLSIIIEKLQLLEELETKSRELQEMNRRLTSAQEEQCAQISAYLHDEPLQKLNYLLWISKEAGVPEEFQGRLRQVSEELRNFTVMLRPAILDDLGLTRALEWLAAERAAQSGIEIDFTTNGLTRDNTLPKDVELALYRVAQEAITNCEKHAKADSLRITLERVGSRICLRVVDNGVGISQTSGEHHPHRLGILGMRERVEQVGGTFSIRRRTPSGTIVEASVSIPAKDE